MAQQFNPHDPKGEDLARLLSREHEDRLDWLENQTPQPAPQDCTPATPRGLLATLRDLVARFRRPASHAD